MAKNKAKKALIITAGVIVVLFAVLLIAPFAFKGKIMQVVKNQANEMLDAQLEFDDVNLSFIRNFPNASVSIENLCIVGKDSFATDTLIYGKNINAVVNLKSLFSDSGYEIKRLILNGINVNAHVLPSGKANWDIMKSDSTEVEEAPDTTALKFNLKLQDLQLKNTNIVYNDEQGAMKAVLKGLNFSTSGDFTADSSLLKTRLTIDKLTYVMDKVPYLSDAEIDVKADINADLNKMIFKLSDNTTKINAIELALNGWVQLLEPEGIAMDLSINSEKVDFKSILSMIPAIYSNQFKDLKADGKVELQAAAKGTMLGETYPTFKVKLLVENGWFQYPELPKQLKNININLAIDNAGDKLETMKIDLSQFSFDMGGNVFQAKAHIEDPLNDPNITATAAGKLDLGQVKDFYPLEEGINLNGVFALDVSLAGRMSYYEKNQYDKFQFAGNMSVTNLLLKTADLKDDVSVAAAQLNFNNRYVDLAKFQAKIGKNDIAASGKLENFVAYV
ncbi:MAG: AsmA family protein, partial [Prevotellaceae bacterium]|nr:AsmA family protein [Prevotellaceae bacterium]